MNHRLVGWFLGLMSALLPVPAPGWGVEGHRAIAQIADEHLDPNARSHVAELLGTQTMIQVSTWADELRLAAKDKGPLRRNPEALAFNRDFPENGNWHFVDLPLLTRNYDEATGFTSEQDVVHAFDRCVSVLENPDQVQNFSRSEALRWLIHLVGDVHQPLHCACGYYDSLSGQVPRLIEDPSDASGKPNDRGGNDLYYNAEQAQQLHAYWDEILVITSAGTSDYHVLAAQLNDRFRSSPVTETSGNLHDWIRAWVIESVELARGAYRGIQFDVPQTGGEQVVIPITLPSGYAGRETPVAANQLYRAGIRLAQVLNRLAWPPK